MARNLDLGGFGERVGALQAEIRGERRIPTTVADGLCAQLGGVLREVRVGLEAPCRRGDPRLDEAARQARIMGGADRFLRATR